MAQSTWILSDPASQTYVPELNLAAADLFGTGSRASVRKHTLQGGPRHGVDVVRVDNGKLAFDVLPTRGMSLWKAWLGELEIGWKSPVPGPVHPALVPLNEPSGLGWLDGFDELLVRCGLESNGAPEFDESGRLRYPLHGRIGNLPAGRVQVDVDRDRGEISVSGVVHEVRFHFLKLRLRTTIKTWVDQPRLEIHDVVENLSASPAEAQLLYHVNFGAPLLDAGSQVVVPAQTVVPRNERAAAGIPHWSSYQAEQPAFEEQVYFLELRGDAQGQTHALLKNSHATQGVSLRFSTRQLPCFTVWKNTTALDDGYVTGLEPATNYPNPRSFEGSQGRVLQLDARGTADFKLGIEVHATAQQVEQAEREVQKLQGDQPPRIFDQPQPGWCEGVDAT